MDIEGVVNIADDLIVHGKTVVEHDQSLHKLLARLEERNPTLNGAKCIFGMSKVVFMGILLSKHGVGPNEEKVRAVKEATRPSSASEVRSFLDLVGFSSRFIPDFASKGEPLRALCRTTKRFLWGKAQEEAFNTLKEDMAGASMMAYFDRGAPTEVIADASPVGLGAVLVQKVDGALTLVWSCERFNLYLCGERNQ